MDELEKRAREAMASLGERRARQRIPDTVREAVLAFARARRGEGVGWSAIAETVGLSTSALIRWTASSRRSRHNRGRVIPVEVVEESGGGAGSNAVVLVSGNYRIEGLDLAAAADLLRRLA